MSSERPHPPSVEVVLAAVRSHLDGAREPGALLAATRDVVAEERQRLAAGDDARQIDALAEAVVERLRAFEASDGIVPVRVINATGVVVHTNLGRAPWPDAATRAAADAVAGSLLLELDRESGRRGARFRLAEEHLIALTGADDALITNNNAAALALAVGLAGRGGGVAVSRGELVEIGGGVRIPEIVRRAGAKLIEVGTTNRTRVADFEASLAEGRARIVLRVHPSNFTIAGFTESPDPAELAALAHGAGAIVVDDLGSGALLATEAFGLAHEPMPSERLAAAADLVTFSGDKLVGGPQAGLVVGRTDLIARMRRDPLARAMRPDKATLAGVAATLGLYRAGRAVEAIPVWRMIATPSAAIRARAEAIMAAFEGRVRAEVLAVDSTIGGGSLPGQTLPSFAVSIRARSADRFLGALRRGNPPVVGRVAEGRVILDLRTVDPGDDERLAAAVERALQATP